MFSPTQIKILTSLKNKNQILLNYCNPFSFLSQKFANQKYKKLAV